MFRYVFIGLCACVAVTPILAAPVAGYLAERGSKLLGQQFELPGGGRAQLQDMVLRARTGAIAHAVTSTGEPVPLEALGLAGPAAAPGTGDARQEIRDGMRLRDLVAASVENRHGDRVGTIEEVVLNLAARRVDYVVVRFGEDWLGTAKRVAVPIRALAGRSTGGSGWRIDADPARVISLPEFDREHLHRINEAPVIQEVHDKLRQSPWLRPSRSGLDLVPE